MELPEGWRVGFTDKVGPQWMEQWPEKVAEATTQEHIDMLRYVLSERRGWCLPDTIKTMSDTLESRADAINGHCAPIRSQRKAERWHDPIRFRWPENKPDSHANRIIGEGDAA